ncbi:FecCD family ABC transporter permease [Paramicrobacterium chengjingii]|uniref:Iron ABC transporter permease n=1 Tax=Paramicrobacterium chengjingii TaxID=2769067 RepID=A0ABX6YG17_9MICO|nr:iron ABC transporter permease [Microbacterium chengjingii]QPZ37335.1 iron ABC transporter permease [Microbacterium chengjingii]
MLLHDHEIATAQRSPDPLPPRPRTRAVRIGSPIVASFGLLLIALVAVSIGPVSLAPGTVLHALGGLVVPSDSAPAASDLLVSEVRLPRVVLAGLVGAGLSVAGAVMQALFRNPLAEPGITGVSSGATAAAVIAIVTGVSALAWWMLPLAAFVGALVCTAIVHAISSVSRGRSSTIILVGIAANAFLGALVSAVLANASDAADVQRVTFWLNGDLTAATWSDVAVAAVGIPLVAIVLLGLARSFDLMSLSDTQAASTGVNVGLVRQSALALAALVTAAAVCVTGVISFVGLVVPHLVRLLVGPRHARLMWLSALSGAAFLIVADLIARMLFTPVVLQTGTVTAFVGAPALLLLVLRSRRNLQ